MTEYLSDKTFVGLDITGFENTGKYRPVSRVTLMVDDENVYTAGDDTGLELTASCPHATQEMVNALLAQLQGYQYQSFTADAANLDPASELGDGVTVNGVYSIISQLDDDGRGFPDISSPGEVALEEEYPSAGPMTQEFNRQIAETRSQITKTAEEIRLEVKNELEGLSASFSVQLGQIRAELTDEINGLSASVDLKFDGLEASFEDKLNGLSADFDVKLNGLQANFEDEINGLSSTLNVKIDGIEASLEDEINGLSSSINLQIDSITSTVQGLDGQVSTIQQTVGSITTQITGINGEISSLEQTATSLQTQIRNAQGDISTIEQYVDSITLSVSNGSTSSTIQLKAGSTTISSANITFNGMVTFNDLSTAGSTVINGANITTGTISADRINLTGAITWGDLDNSVQNDINDAISTAEDAYQLASGIELPDYIHNTYIGPTEIESPTIIAGEFYGNEFNVYPQSGDSGSFNLYGDTSQSSGFHMLEISYYWGDGAFVDFGSPAGAIARWEFGSTRFNGTTISFESGTDVSFNGAVDFSRADVTGLYMVFD